MTTVRDFYDNPTFWFYLVTMLPYLVFVVLYGVRSPWSRTPIGRNIMLLNASIVLILTNVLGALVFGEYLLRDAIRVVCLGGVLAAGWYQVKNVLVAQKKDRYSRRQPVE